jgi:FkbM family methyltransferase
VAVCGTPINRFGLNVREYSQLGQDRFVLQLLNFLRGGFFLDSGASNGIIASNTYLLESEYNWRGICVEPNSAFYEELVKNRTSRCIQCCLYDTEAMVDFVEAGTLGGVLKDYPPTLLSHVAGMGLVPKDVHGWPIPVLKPSRTISSVLQQFGAPHIIDYWSLDTEGSELRILKSFPFTRYRVRVITVEHNRHPVRAEIRRFLEGHGYMFIMDFGIDDCYIDPSSVTRHLVRRRWRHRFS